MASLQQKPSGWYCQFYLLGKRYTVGIGQLSPDLAAARAARIAELVRLIAGGLVSPPPGVDIVEFVRHDGRPPAAESQQLLRSIALGSIVDAFIAAHETAREPGTLRTARIHAKHLEATLGRGFDLARLTRADLQSHVDRRCRTVAVTTVRKEIATLSAAWAWAAADGRLGGIFPAKGLVYPKVDERPPFRTRAEIERVLPGLSEVERAVAWECLYLTLDEIGQFLGVVRAAAAHPWIHPLVATAAHAGLRRSELVRAQVDDVDFEAGVLHVRERKRVRGARSRRRVPLSGALVGILREWLAGHPGGPLLFAQTEVVARSKKRSPTTGHRSGPGRPTSLEARRATVSSRARGGVVPLTVDEVTDHFRRTVRGGPWDVVPGLHCLRHSFISACASKGLDLAMIQSWCGHMSTETQRRYLHLYPDVQADAMRAVFG